MIPASGSSPLVFDTAEAEASAWLWFDWFLAQPHPLIGRKGHVCPFVDPARRAGTLRTEMRTLAFDEGLDPEQRAGTMRAEVSELEARFAETDWGYRNQNLQALVFVFPALRPEDWPLLDEVQRDVKLELVGRGLMLGQFHPACEVPAARNHLFEVSRAPVPMLAVRNMAIHDVLFLDEDPRMFAAYRARFGARYAHSRGIDPLFVEHYAAAVRRHSGSGTKPRASVEFGSCGEPQATEPDDRAT